MNSGKKYCITDEGSFFIDYDLVVSIRCVTSYFEAQIDFTKNIELC